MLLSEFDSRSFARSFLLVHYTRPLCWLINEPLLTHRFFSPAITATSISEYTKQNSENQSNGYVSLLLGIYVIENACGFFVMRWQLVAVDIGPTQMLCIIDNNNSYTYALISCTLHTVHVCGYVRHSGWSNNEPIRISITMVWETVRTVCTVQGVQVPAQFQKNHERDAYECDYMQV